MPSIASLRVWRNGEVFNARDYVYERDLLVAQINRVTALIGDSSGDSNINLTVNRLTATELVLNGETLGDLGDFMRGQAVYSAITPVNQEEGDIWFYEET